jgi:hypothetical protein
MSTKEHLKSSEAMTAQTEPKLSLVGQSEGQEDSSKKQVGGKHSLPSSKDKISPTLGASPDRYCDINTLIKF